MRATATRRTAFTAVLVLALILGFLPFHQVEFAQATPDVVEATVHVESDFHTSDGDTKRTDAIETPIAFTGLWLHLDTEVEDANVRTSVDGDTWTAWTEVGMLDDEDGPDTGTDEAAAYDDTGSTSELFIGDEANFVQLEVPAQVGEIEIQLADASGANDSVFTRVSGWFNRSAVPAAEANDTPAWVTSRDQWGASEPRNSIEYADGGVNMAVVHHTASSNNYSRDGVDNQLRIIQNYHMSLGWSDIGYNVLVDKFGRVYEGRAGGFERAVIGAHASGFNTGSFGVAVMGDFSNEQAPQVAIDALTRVIGHKADLHGFNPTGSVQKNGQSHPTVVGHQDVGQTACPGLIQNRLPQIRANASSQANTPVSPFDDISYNSEHGRAVVELHSAGVINGCGSGQFCPRQALTRGQAASLIARALDLDGGDGSVFSDVGSGGTHSGTIGAVASRGIVTGFDDGTFKPDQRLTREQMASILARAMNLSPRGGGQFSDVGASGTHGGNIYAIADAGIAQGCANDRYCPADTVTREQMASFIHRMRQHMGIG